MWFLVSTALKASCADGFKEPSQVAKKKKKSTVLHILCCILSNNVKLEK